MTFLLLFALIFHPAVHGFGLAQHQAHERIVVAHHGYDSR